MRIVRTPAQRRLRLVLGCVGATAGGVWGAVAVVLAHDPDVAQVLSGRSRGAALAGVIALLSAVPVGALLGAPPLDLLSHAVGRRPAVLACAVLGALGSLVAAVTAGWGQAAGALVAGLGIGGYAVVSPKVAHELAERGHRRIIPRLSGILPAGAGLALLAGELGDRLLPGEGVVGAWVVPLVLSVAALLLLLGLPETPHWYAAHGKVGAAHAALRRMNGPLEAAVGIDWVLMDAGMLGEQHPISAGDLRIDRVRRTVLAGLLLDVVQAVPLGLTAICLTPVLLALRTGARAPLWCVLVLAVAWAVLAALSLLRRPGHMVLAWVLGGTALAACGVVLLSLAPGLSDLGARWLVLVVATTLVAAQYVCLAPACTGGTDPLVPPWLLRSQRRAGAVTRPLVQLVAVVLPTVLLAGGVRLPVLLAVVLALQVVSLLVFLAALPRLASALR